jgi:hypothetical protein
VYYNFAQFDIVCLCHAEFCMCVCVLVVLEMPFNSTFSATAGATELMRDWEVAQKIALIVFSNVADWVIVS